MGRLITIPYSPRPAQREMHAGMESRRFAVCVAHRRCGKTVAVINHMIKQAALSARKWPPPKYAYIAPQYKQAKRNAWQYVLHYAKPIPGVRTIHTDLMVILPNGAEITLLGADNPDALRGSYLDGAILDEVGQMKREIWHEVVLPMLADYRGWAVHIGTPKGQNFFHEINEQARKNPEVWFSATWPVTKTGIFGSGDLDLLKATMSDAAYRQEFLCDWSASSENVLIPFDLAHEAMQRLYNEDDYRFAPKVLGVDVARYGDDRSVLIRRQGLQASGIKIWRGLRTTELGDLVAQEIREWEPDATFIDGDNMGAGTVDYLRQLGLDVIEVRAGRKATQDKHYANRRAEMWDQVLQWLEDGGALPGNEPDLLGELCALQYSYDSQGRLKLEPKDDAKVRLGRSPDIADALAHTFYAPVASAMTRRLARPDTAKWDYDVLMGPPHPQTHHNDLERF